MSDVPETKTEYKTEEEIKFISVDVRLLEQIVSYLSQRPYNEVTHILSSFVKK